MNRRPDAQHQSHTRRLLSMTYLRFQHTRARSQQESPADIEDATRMAERFVRLLNGDLRLPLFQHLCMSMECCNGQQVAQLISTRLHGAPRLKAFALACVWGWVGCFRVASCRLRSCLLQGCWLQVAPAGGCRPMLATHRRTPSASVSLQTEARSPSHAKGSAEPPVVNSL